MALKTGLDYKSMGGISDGHRTNMIRPAQHVTQWVTVGDPSDPDAPNVADTGDDPTAFTRTPIAVGSCGTNLRVRLNYEEDNVTSTAPLVRVYGRTSCPDAPAGHVEWQLLHNRAQEIDVPLATAANDVNVGGRKVTRANQETHMWDIDGCDEVVVSVRDAYVVSSGTASDAWLEIKTI